jgi:hypothetical protein
MVNAWRPLLERRSRDRLDEADDIDRELLDPEVLKSQWLGHPPASEAAIAAAEARLRVVLPSSYRSFLLTANGWRGVRGRPCGICDLVDVESLTWLTEDGNVEWLFESAESTGRAQYFAEQWRIPKDEIRLSLAVGRGDGNEYILLAPKRASASRPTGERPPLGGAADADWNVWTYDHEEGFYAYASFLKFMTMNA